MCAYAYLLYLISSMGDNDVGCVHTRKSNKNYSLILNLSIKNDRHLNTLQLTPAVLFGHIYNTDILVFSVIFISL